MESVPESLETASFRFLDGDWSSISELRCTSAVLVTKRGDARTGDCVSLFSFESCRLARVIKTTVNVDIVVIKKQIISTVRERISCSKLKHDNVWLMHSIEYCS